MAKKQTKSAANVPAGFKALTGGSEGQTWKPEIGDTLTGVVMGKKQLDATKAGRENAKKGDKVWIVTVADGDGTLHAVWESKALETFCNDVKIGAKVFLRLDDVKKIGKKRFKVFTAGTIGGK